MTNSSNPTTPAGRVPGPEPDPPPFKEPPQDDPNKPDAPVDEPEPIVPKHVQGSY